MRMFHSQSKKQMDQHGATGDLCIIMTAYNEGKPYLLGVATGVRSNTPAEMKAMAKYLKIRGEADNLWALDTVRKAFRTRDRFEKHWAENFHWLQWQAPQDSYAWFDSPIPINISKVFHDGRKRIALMHSSYMAWTPQQAQDALRGIVPRSSKIWQWLSSGEFVVRGKSVTAKKTTSTSKGVTNKNGAAPPTDPVVRYLKSHEIEVSPEHHKLQSRFEAWLDTDSGVANENRVDFRYRDKDGGLVLVEVKPCDDSSARFAIRTAIGQLLDYGQLEGKKHKALILISVKPPSELDEGLAIKNGFGLAYPLGRGFHIVWPD